MLNGSAFFRAVPALFHIVFCFGICTAAPKLISNLEFKMLCIADWRFMNIQYHWEMDGEAGDVYSESEDSLLANGDDEI